jgi:DNA/RNA-binding domain of Phe-tRNA-synthetase-like protein
VLERTYVTNYSDLVDAEIDLEKLYEEIEEVDALISALSDPIDLDDQDDLEAAREAYDALTPEQQGYVIGFPSLVEAEEDFQTLLDEIDAVEAMIAALPIPVTMSDDQAVQAARDAFDALNPLQQAQVTNSIVLTNAEARLLDLEVADTVSVEVMALPFEDDVTLDDQAAIEAAREAYEALTPAQKGMVSGETLQHLVNAENGLDRLLNPGFDFFSLLPYHVASGLIIAVLFFIKSKKQGV